VNADGCKMAQSARPLANQLIIHTFFSKRASPNCMKRALKL
jgi:hypothetical protein